MKELFINEVISKANCFLDDNQRIKLKEILTEICLNYQITIIKQTKKQETQNNNTDILNKFIAAKEIEGCSNRTLNYYKDNITNLKKNKEDSLIRSSTAEYLTYIAATGDNPEAIEVRYEDENIWLTQKMLATVYGIELNTINYHIKKIYEDKELTEDSTIRNFRIVQKEGNREVSRNIAHYNLQMIIAIGFKVDNEKAIQFRKWANQIIKDYTIKGWVMDDERLKNGGSILTEKYFEEQLERIREIRMSERKFYQKITDIYATSIDYDKTAKSTIRFFTSVQNKLHYAVSGNTAAEIIYNRADHKKENMGLTSWNGAPSSKIHKYDIVIAKNYLSENEIGQLERLVSAYLDLAEMQAIRHIPMTMADWEERLNGFLTLWDHNILQDNGKISAEMAKLHAETEFEKYRVIQDKNYISDFDELLTETKNLNNI